MMRRTNLLLFAVLSLFLVSPGVASEIHLNWFSAANFYQPGNAGSNLAQGTRNVFDTLKSIFGFSKTNQVLIFISVAWLISIFYIFFFKTEKIKYPMPLHITSAFYSLLVFAFTYFISQTLYLAPYQAVVEFVLLIMASGITTLYLWPFIGLAFRNHFLNLNDVDYFKKSPTHYIKFIFSTLILTGLISLFIILLLSRL
jgi:hypothetical protein